VEVVSYSYIAGIYAGLFWCAEVAYVYVV